MRISFATCVACILILLTASSSCQNHSSNTLAQPISDSATYPLTICGDKSADQICFESVVAHQLKARLIPNNGRRKELGITKISGVLGITHFFLDFDLTTGYVHPYTINFFNKLGLKDFVLKFDRTPGDSTLGYVSYIRKEQMQEKDKLGQNIGFFRQWKLSEIDYRENKGVIEILVKPSTFSSACVSPQAKAESTSAFGHQIPFWCEGYEDGYFPLENFSKLDRHNGGTVVVIWQDQKSGQILFQDIHNSLLEVMKRAIAISKEYNTDPVIAISDAGPMANKFLSSEKHELDCTKFPLVNIPHAGAGFGYVPGQEGSK
ncbi:MAG: hypothetical protein JWO06_853 [Bacteroidota bacterium]|nr:hypothetical protein [Bacteroidota bacterium]